MAGCAGINPALVFDEGSTESKGLALIQELRQQQSGELRMLTWRYNRGQQYPNELQKQQLSDAVKNGVRNLHVIVGPAGEVSKLTSALIAQQRAHAIASEFADRLGNVTLSYDPALTANTVRIEWAEAGHA